jgi:hypothetical protein
MTGVGKLDTAQLLKMSFDELDALVGRSPAGPIPNGPAQGMVIIAPDTAFSEDVARGALDPRRDPLDRAGRLPGAGVLGQTRPDPLQPRFRSEVTPAVIRQRSRGYGVPRAGGCSAYRGSRGREEGQVGVGACSS